MLKISQIQKRDFVHMLTQIAEKTGNAEYIHGKGDNELENKKKKIKFVRFLYLPPKGNCHTVDMREKKKKDVKY